MSNEERVAASMDGQKPEDGQAALDRWDAGLAEGRGELDAPRLRLERAWCLSRLGRLEEAESEFAECARLRPLGAAGFIGLAQIAWQRKNWDLARERFELLLATFPAAAANRTWRGRLAECLTRLGQYTQAETHFRALASDNPATAATWIGLARLAERRGDWAEAAARWADGLSRSPTAPRGWRVSRAQALAKASLWKQAFYEWDALAQADGARADILVLRARVRAYLAWKGPDPQAEQWAQIALAAFPRDLSLNKLSAEIARRRGDDAEALNRYAKVIDINPLDIDSYSSAMRAAIRTCNTDAAAEICGRCPPSLALDDEFKSRVLISYFEGVRKYQTARRVIDTINFETVSVRGAFNILMRLRALHDFPRMSELARLFFNRFPDDPQIAGLYLYALRHTESDAIFQVEKMRLVAPMSEADAYRALSILRPGWLSAAEARRVIDFEFSRQRDEAPNFGNLSRFAFRRDTGTLTYLADRIARAGGLGGRLLAEAMRVQVLDRERIAFANLHGAHWSEFHRAAESLAARHARLLAQEEASAAPQDRLLDLSLRLRSLRERSPAVRIDTAASYHEAAEFAAWLAERIRRREPTSVLRLCDGEGNFLPYPESFREFQDADQRAIQQTWWGGGRIAGAEVEITMARFQKAIANADAIGVPPQTRLAIYLQDKLRTPNERGLASSLAYVSRLDQRLIDTKLITSCDINNDLEDWDLYRQVFSSLCEISFISCHDLRRALAQRFGLAVRQARRIPGEYAFSQMFSNAPEAAAPFYPDAFNELIRTLVVERGEVFLVAAGFLGKLLCDHIRELGGVAIDIGSIADLWTGHGTRNRDHAEFEFDVASSLIDGHPFCDDFRTPDAALGDRCQSDRSRRRNLSPRFDSLFPAPETRPPARYPLRVIGPPRCGLRYAAKVLTALGLDVGHERVGSGGLCSWIHTVEDFNPACKAPVLGADDFQLTLGYIRNPAAAIPSIMLENCHTESFAFRRFHVARELGRDIAKRRDPFERAVDSLVSWMEIVERRHPALVLRAESLLDDLAEYDRAMRAHGLEIDWTRKTQAMAVPTATDSTSLDFRGSKPVLSRERYAALPSDLRDALEALCERYRYPFPSGEVADRQARRPSA